MTVALTWVPCRQCGEACVSTPARCWQALCQSCATPKSGSIVDTGDARLTYAQSPCRDCSALVFHVPDWPEPLCLDCSRRRCDLDDSMWLKPIGPWRPTIARVLAGELGPIVRSKRNELDDKRAAKLAAERARYRVLVPARPARRHEMPAAALAAVDALQDGRGQQCVSATYAQAEDTERAELVRSIALASVVENVKGVAFWENGRWAGGMTLSPTHHSCSTLDEWIVRARGEEWTPPSCPRCGRLGVKTRQNGQPYKHKTTDGEDCT